MAKMNKLFILKEGGDFAPREEGTIVVLKNAFSNPNKRLNYKISRRFLPNISSAVEMERINVFLDGLAEAGVGRDGR